MTRQSARAPCLGVLVACAIALGPVAIAAAAPDGLPIAGWDAAAIRSVITAQIDAFRHDDAEGAYRIASPQIETRFGNAATFLAMVKTTYPAVYGAHDVNFGPVVRQGGAIVQQVGLVGPDGMRAVALYTMEHEAGGSWRIDGCVLAADPSQAA